MGIYFASSRDFNVILFIAHIKRRLGKEVFPSAVLPTPEQHPALSYLAGGGKNKYTIGKSCRSRSLLSRNSDKHSEKATQWEYTFLFSPSRIKTNARFFSHVAAHERFLPFCAAPSDASRVPVTFYGSFSEFRGPREFFKSEVSPFTFTGARQRAI